MKNRIACLECGEVLWSKFCHDLKSCECSNESFVDGGNDYQRVGGMDMRKILFLSESSPDLQSLPLWIRESIVQTFPKNNKAQDSLTEESVAGNKAALKEEKKRKSEEKFMTDVRNLKKFLDELIP